MKLIQSPFVNEDSQMMMECASKIASHLARNIVKHRDTPEIANRMSAMNKYIQVKYIHNNPSSEEENRLSA